MSPTKHIKIKSCIKAKPNLNIYLALSTYLILILSTLL